MNGLQLIMSALKRSLACPTLPPFEELLGDSDRNFVVDPAFALTLPLRPEEPIFVEETKSYLAKNCFDSLPDSYGNAPATSMPCRLASLGSAAEDPAPRECLSGLAEVGREDTPSQRHGGPFSFTTTDGQVSGKKAEEICRIFRKFCRSQVMLGTDDVWLHSAAGFLDLYSDEKGVAREIFLLSGIWALTFDIIYGADQDLSSPSLRADLEWLSKNRCFHGRSPGPSPL